MLPLFDQVEPAISKQVEFSNGYMHAGDDWNEFTNKLITSGANMTLRISSKHFILVLQSPHSEFYGDAAWFNQLRH